MFCTHCGHPGTGNYCGECGTPLGAEGGEKSYREDPSDIATGHWEHEVRYAVLMRYPSVRKRLAKGSKISTRKLTGEEWLGLYDRAFKPLTGVSLRTVASIVAPIYAQIGIKTGKTRRAIVPAPPGQMMVEFLCALAESDLPLTEVHQGEQGCVFEAKLPSDLWSFEGQLVVSVERADNGTCIEAATSIPGQWYDWGKSTRCLDRLFGYVGVRAA